ncbi:MAG: GDP-mannose 4,6-dehydratase [Chloroflexi bacterium]|nr:GDP-mannose 4,6-dehydratase [Chloroflexota bacterium]
MARVLVTGGAGFIGSHLTEALVARGDRVRVLDNFSSGDPRNLAGLENKIELIQGDLRNRADILEAVRDVEIIFHHAALVSVPMSIENPRDCFDVNVSSVIELLEAARRVSVRRILLASSAAVYGARMDFPLREDTSPDCRSPYATSKQFNETLASLYTHIYQLPAVVLRYFNIYGPRQSPKSMYAAVIPKFIERLKAGKPPIVYGDGMQTRDFVYAADVVRANLLAVESERAAGHAINICSGSETNLLELLEILHSIFPKAPEAEFAETRLGDLPRSVGDPSLAAELLNFKVQIPLHEGLKRCVAEWRA